MYNDDFEVINEESYDNSENNILNEELGELIEFSKIQMKANEISFNLQETNKQGNAILARAVQKLSKDVAYINAKANLHEEKHVQHDEKHIQYDSKFKDIEEEIFRIGHEPLRHKKWKELQRAKSIRVEELYSRGILVNGSRLSKQGIHGLIKIDFKEHFDLKCASMYDNLNGADFSECLEFLKNYHPAIYAE